MPTALGEFISTYVYNDKLRSHHKVEGMECVAFIDVSKGCEQRSGTSWVVSTLLIFLIPLTQHFVSEPARGSYCRQRRPKLLSTS